MNKNEILCRIYDEAYAMLMEKSKVLGIDESNLEGYFNPLSKEHVDYYNRRYNLKFNFNKINSKHSDKEYKNFLFMRFVSSLYNKGNEYYITNNKMERQLAIALNRFDLDKFLSFNDFEMFEKHLKENKKCSLLFGKRYSKGKNKKGEYTYHLKNLYISIKDIARLIDSNLNSLYKMKMEQVSSYSSFENYYEQVSKFISSQIASHIKGMGITLLADAVKEAGLIDTIKPDRHIQNTIFDLFDIDLDVNKVTNKSFKRVLRLFYDIAIAYKKENDIELSIYQIDKVIYMYAARGNNGFYIHDDFKSDRDRLVDKLRNIDGVSQLRL